MEIVATIFGYFFLTCVVVTGVLLAFAFAAEKLRLLRAKERQLTRDSAVADVGRSLINDAWWFSEDKRTMDLLTEYGDRFVRTKSTVLSVGQIRQKWRESTTEPAMPTDPAER